MPRVPGSVSLFLAIKGVVMALFKKLVVKCRAVEIHNHCETRDDGPRVVFAIGPDMELFGPVEKTPSLQCKDLEGDVMVEVEMTNTQFKIVKLKPFKNRRGGAARIDGVPQWKTNNSEVLSLVVSDDGMQCKVQTVGLAGEADLQVDCDVDLGSGVENKTGLARFTITLAKPESIELDFGDAQEIEDDPAPDSPPPSDGGGEDAPVDLLNEGEQTA